MSTAKKLVNITELVDRLGRIKADISDLKEEEEKALKTLKDRGVGEYSGKLFAAQVFTQERNKQTNYEELAKDEKIPQRIIDKYTKRETVVVTTIDWPTVLKEADVGPKTIAKHTTSQEVTVCKVTARK